jgi:hypothetical protein
VLVALEALEPSDALLDASAGFVEGAGEEGRLVLFVGLVRAHNLLPAVGMNRLPARRGHRQAAQEIKAIEKAARVSKAQFISTSITTRQFALRGEPNQAARAPRVVDNVRVSGAILA